MAERIDEASYLAMVEALYHFADRTAKIGKEIQDEADMCRSALDEEDSSIQEIYRYVLECQKRHNRVAKQAANLARDMMDELERSQKERSVWEDED